MKTLRDIRKTISPRNEGPTEIEWFEQTLRKEAKNLIKKIKHNIHDKEKIIEIIKQFFNIKQKGGDYDQGKL